MNEHLYDRHGRTITFMREVYAQTTETLERTKALVARLTVEKEQAESRLRVIEAQAAFEAGIFEGLGVSTHS